MADYEGAEDMAALRAKYQSIVGRKPFHGWGAEKLHDLITQHMTSPPPPTAPAPAPAEASPDKATKTIVLLCPHVFLPKDPTQPGWETSDDTLRYVDKGDDGERIKYEVDPGLAEFLAKRDQAIVVG